MKHILILAAPHYDVTGPMRTIICGYGDCLKKHYDVTIIKMPYHMLPFQKRQLWNKLEAAIRPETVAIIPSCLNICYYLLKLKKWIRKDIQLIAWPGDCATCAGLSELGAIGKQMQYPGLRKMMLKLARVCLYRFKECRILKKYRKVLIITETDIEYLKTHFKKIKADLRLLPYSFNIPSNAAGSCKADKNKELRVGFLGHFKQDSFEQYFERFLSGCEKKIIREVPQLKIVIAGRNATKEQIALLRKYPFVEYLGEVSELEDFYSGVHFIFTTIPKQSGILTKVVEACAYGKCVVGYRSNFIPIAGIKEGTDYLVADTAEEFADIFKAAIEGKVDIEGIGKSAREAMIHNYSWEANGPLLEKYINEGEELENE